ncbi:MAG: hypothetical protein IPK64_10900 [bacterium]|nr:hypothetical protein [bacterium]
MSNVAAIIGLEAREATMKIENCTGEYLIGILVAARTTSHRENDPTLSEAEVAANLRNSPDSCFAATANRR